MGEINPNLPMKFSVSRKVRRVGNVDIFIRFKYEDELDLVVNYNNLFLF